MALAAAVGRGSIVLLPKYGLSSAFYLSTYCAESGIIGETS
jgi:hypothetical protein